jgi:hypothetical protein
VKQSQKKRANHAHAITGFTHDEIVDLCALIISSEENRDFDRRPKSVGLFRSVVIAFAYMRRNGVQEELAESHQTSQPTISRAMSRITSRLAIVLTPFILTGAQHMFTGAMSPT